MKKKLLIGAIAGLLAILTCCSTAGTGNNKQTGDSSSETSGDDTESVRYVADYLPDTDLNGLKFNILNIDQDSTNLILEFSPDASSDNVVSAAIYKRNQIIQDRYNMKFIEVIGGDYKDLDTKFGEIISSNDSTYSLVTMIQRYAFTRAMNGFCVLVDDLPYLDTTQPWYVQDVNEQFSINGIKVFAYSDECINLFEQTECVLYNKKLIADNSKDLVDPYDLVKAGTWTIDAFLEQARSAVNDLDGDGKINDIDVVGCVGSNGFVYPTLWMGAGYNLVNKNDDGVPIFDVSTNEELVTLLQKMLTYVKMDGVFFDVDVDVPVLYKNSDLYESIRQIFKNDHALYTVTTVSDIKLLNDMSSDFGIVPSPKLDERQETYKSRVIDGWLKVVPTTNNDLETTSLIMEALAVESKNYVYEPYYELTMQGRYTRDDDGKSNEMLDLVFNTRTQDLGDTAWKGSCLTIFMGCFASKSDTFVSESAKYEDEINYNIKKELRKITSGQLRQ